ncbi:uncharacterized protein LOC114517447 [Dendronephthya gigantea]|uniref:uncharacterized protein LOC114517447 n=1 Tax=Dendronephthya gigantea TaxID=151771 RepID=UPI00106AA883|nr:uncharacterized protein LOC114517447 [Dendronephthya gigantea]
MPREYRRSKKRKFCGNRYDNSAKKKRVDTVDGDTISADPSTSAANEAVLNTSASAKKIGFSDIPDDSSYSEQSQSTDVSGYRFVDLQIMSEFVSEVCCKECGSSCLVLEDNPRERKGSASHLRARCEACGWVYTFYTSKKVGHSFDVNKRFVYAMRSLGEGHTSAKRFCALMDMPPPLQPTAYRDCNIALAKAAKAVATTTMLNAANEVKKDPTNQINQCSVSCDGTWQRRGHSSLNGCVTTLSMDTGKCLDVEILTKVCHGCQKVEREKDLEEKAAKKEVHISKCKINHKGSSAAMETEGVKRIFRRSEEDRKLQYTEYFGDGDSKAHAEVENIYHGIKIAKKECVGHVQKRVGTALRKLKKENKGIGGKGKLTNTLIDKLQNYYGIAIRSNSGDLKAMKAAIFASLFHCVSSKKRNLHTHCPDGPNSWCRFKQDKANNTTKYVPGPGLPDNIIKLIRPIYERLSSDELLSKCLDGKTQNQNESLNGMIWNRIPKNVFVGANVLELGVYDAVAHFNIGAEAAVNLLKEVKLKPGKFCVEGLNKINKERVKRANVKAKECSRKKRKILRGQKKRKDEKLKEEEGTTYKSGGF